MQHQDTTIVPDVGQDGHSGDKSIRLTIPYTQMGIASILDLGIANDGLLAGRELESDAELVALGWLKPVDLFEGDELPAIYPEDDAREQTQRLAARQAEREAKRRAERASWLACFPEDRTAFELAEDTGWVGGQLEKTPIIDRSNGDFATRGSAERLPKMTTPVTNLVSAFLTFQQSSLAAYAQSMSGIVRPFCHGYLLPAQIDQAHPYG